MILKQLGQIIAFTVSLSILPCAHATPATSASINQLFDTLQIQQQTKAMVQSQQLKQLGLDQEQLWTTIEPQLKQAYQNSLSEEEIQALNRFYHTEEGQSLAKKMPELTQQTYKIVLQNAMTHSQISQGLFKLLSGQ